MLRLVAFVAPIFITGCSTTARMYPVEGPASLQAPAQPLQATINGIMGNNGSLTFTLPDGVPCAGEWSSAAGVQATFGTGSLLTQYGPIYGAGYSITSGGGQSPGQAIATCTDGTRFDIEFVTGGGTANGFGFARDTRGNVYRLLF